MTANNPLPPLTPAEQAMNDQSRQALADMGITLAPQVNLAMLFAVSADGFATSIAQPYMPPQVAAGFLRAAADMIEGQSR